MAVNPMQKMMSQYRDAYKNDNVSDDSIESHVHDTNHEHVDNISNIPAEGQQADFQVERTYRSLILKYMTREVLAELHITADRHDIDNNTKTKVMNEILTESNVPYAVLGSGTNRYAVIVDGYAVKIALDIRGRVDNQREFVLANDDYISDFVTKCYECTPTGTIATFEYVTIFSKDDYWENQEEMREILAVITSKYFVGDMGVNAKNYINWGKRSDGSLVILDYAYMYTTSYHKMTCNCSDTILEYDNDFNYLVCSECHRKFSFGEIRKRITKEDEQKEIGDIVATGIALTRPIETTKVFVSKIKNYFTKDKKVKRKEKKKEKVKDFDETIYDLSAEEQMKQIFGK